MYRTLVVAIAVCAFAIFAVSAGPAYGFGTMSKGGAKKAGEKAPAASEESAASESESAGSESAESAESETGASGESAETAPEEGTPEEATTESTGEEEGGETAGESEEMSEESTEAEMESTEGEEAAMESSGGEEAGIESTEGIESTAPAEAAPLSPQIEGLLKNMDKRAESIKTLRADISIVSQEDIAGGRSSRRNGQMFMRKPDSIFLDLNENGYPRKVWILADKIVDYSPDLNSAIEVDLESSAGRPMVLGLSTTSDQLRENFDMGLDSPTIEHPDTYILTLTPKADKHFDFTSADVVLDATTLMPERIVQKNADTGITKTYEIYSAMENAKIRDNVFVPELPSNVSVQKYGLGEWKGF